MFVLYLTRRAQCSDVWLQIMDLPVRVLTYWCWVRCAEGMYVNARCFIALFCYVFYYYMVAYRWLYLIVGVLFCIWVG